MQFIDLAAQQELIRDAVDAAIAEVLSHGRYIMGPEVAELEGALGAFCGAPEVVSCASGTDALLLALMLHGVGPGDAVLVPSFTFASTAEVVALLGATPVFVDVEAHSFNLDPARVAEAFDDPPPGTRIVGIIAVDLFGQPADYPAIGALAASNDAWVVADAAQSFGATLGGTSVGDLADITTTSFFPAKPLGCYGDGGAIMARSTDDAVVLRSMRVHGSGTHKYDNTRIGINGRLDTIQAAILLQKLTLFPGELTARAAVAERYRAALEGVVATPQVIDGATSAWAQYTVRVPERDRVVAELKDAGVPTAVYYPRPLHQQTAYREFPVAPGGLAVSERLSGEVLSLPMHPYLSTSDQDRVIETLVDAASR
ncbi:MAG: DegT/DnrJ/EryC1/StrS family aminotransferase [Microthrixaceae bacterium]